MTPQHRPIHGRPSRRLRTTLFGGALALVGSTLAFAELPEVPVPVENTVTESKRVLGKLLFWEEQLSSDDSMACGTCHMPATGGADRRIAFAAGADGVFETADDVRGSPGVVRTGSDGLLVKDAEFGLGVRVTGRAANPAILAQYADELFWDGRASDTFVDPETGQVSIQTGGALESQVVGPPLSDVEMAHEGRDWDAVTAKLERVVPMALASDLPTDMADAVASGADYPALFEAAFGDDAITAERIAFAIATYERTLVPDQTPWDRFQAGETNALTQAEQRGWNAFRNNASACNECHEAPLFTDGSFRNIGVRPVAEDTGRQAVTDDVQDRGKFKVPTLRNVGLKRTFMHGGQLTTLDQVLRFYAGAPGTQQFRDNQDPLVRNIRIPPPAQADIVAFLEGGLTDPRVEAETFPFDRPTLQSERPRNPAVVGAGVSGTGGRVPLMVAASPPSLGNDAFVLGVDRGTPGADARLVVSASPPVGGRLLTGDVLGPVQLGGSGAGDGHGSMVYPIPADSSREGSVLYFQWRVTDAAAPDGVALSAVAVATLVGEAWQDLPDTLPGDGVVDPGDGDDGGGDDGGEEPVDPVVVGADSLYLDRGSFAVAWAQHANGRTKDRLQLQGRVSMAGGSGAAGTRLTLTVGDAVLLDAVTLDDRGRLSDSTDDGTRRTVRLDDDGGYRISISRTDLRTALGLTEETGTAALDVAVALRIDEVGLDTPRADGTFGFALRNGTRAAKGSFRLGRDDVSEPVFGTRKAKVKRKGLGHAVVLSAALAGADQSLLPTGELSLTVGDAAPLTIPLASLRTDADGFRYDRRLLPVNGLRKLTVDLSRGKLTLKTDELAGTGLATDDGTADELPVRLEFDTADGPVALETVLCLSRRSRSSRTWKQ